jgi:hypothetical protein
MRFPSRPEPSVARSVNWRGTQAREPKEERVLMPPENLPDGNTPNFQPRCQMEQTLLGGACERPGEVRYKGLLLCGPHQPRSDPR